MNMMNNKNQGSPLMNANMMTGQMLQQNNQMKAMMQQMQAMNMNPMQMQQMQAMMMNQQQQMQPNANLFQSAMQNVNQSQQPQRQNAQQYGMQQHNDPFANIGKSNQSAPAMPKKTGPDPFAQFGLNSMK